MRRSGAGRGLIPLPPNPESSSGLFSFDADGRTEAVARFNELAGSGFLPF